jgi:site-specific recombinase XerD
MTTYKDYLLSLGLSNSTVKHYHKHTLDFLAFLDKDNTEAEAATAKEVLGFMNHLKKKGLENLTRSVQLGLLKHFFDYQIAQGLRKDNPAKHLKIRGIKRHTLYPTLSKQEMEAIYHNYTVPTDEDPRANRNWFKTYQLSRQRNKTILGLMIWQGITTPEANKLTPHDINLKEGTIYIAGSRKGAERTLELKPQQIIGLMEYQLTTRNELQKYCSRPSEYFYITTPASGQKTATGQYPLNMWKRLSDEAEKLCPRFINFKQVRSSVITHWLAGHNLRLVQYMAGHKYVSSTEGYLVNQVEDLQFDIDQYHPIG